MGDAWTGGNPSSVEGIYFVPSGNPVGFPSVTQAAIEISDMNDSSEPASTINAALLIQSQTPGANVYGINTGAGPSLLGDIFSPGTLTLSDGTSEATLYGEGYEWNCADCDTPAYSGAACTNVGDMAGARAIYIQGAAYCGGKATGAGGGSPGGSPTQIQYNLGGSFAGIAGSAVDTSGDVTIAPTVPTTVALWVFAANDETALVASSTGDGVSLDTIAAYSTNTGQSISWRLAQL